MAVIKITSTNVGFTISNNDADAPASATITSRLPASVSLSPLTIEVTSPIIISSFVAGQKTFTYITSSLADVAAIEGAVTAIPASSECV